MSKEEQFEHIENKIKQAIHGEEPPFDEKAWAKMEALLDKDEKKRRPFFWLVGVFLLLVIGAGGIYYFNIYQGPGVSNNVKKSLSLTTKTKSTSGSTGTISEKKNDQIVAETSEKNIEQLNPTTMGKLEDGVQTNANRNPANQQSIEKRRSAVVFNNADGIADEKGSKQMHRDRKKITDKAKTTITTQGNEPEEIVRVNDENKAEVKKETVSTINSGKDSNLISVEKIAKKIDSNNTKAAIQKKQNEKVEKKSSAFYFLASLGADVGGVKLFSYKNSSVGIRYGLGIGYQLNRKLSLQTGFYAGKKVYSAGPSDYHVKADSYWNYVILTKVDAACMVYEIPITVRYNFLQKTSVSYYGTVGVSSYLMKKEDYNYYYVRYNTPAEKYYSYTGNKHLFSTLLLSAGIEKRLSPNFSLQAEPSVSLALSGVGDGKVKLYSSAIMLSLKYLPSRKIKNKKQH